MRVSLFLVEFPPVMSWYWGICVLTTPMVDTVVHADQATATQSKENVK